MIHITFILFNLKISQLMNVLQNAQLGSLNFALTLSLVTAPAMKPDNALNMEATPFCMPNIVPENENTIFHKMAMCRTITAKPLTPELQSGWEPIVW
jgi:hypothetical protein